MTRKTIIKAWVSWTLILALLSYGLLLAIHSSLTVDRFRNVAEDHPALSPKGGRWSDGDLAPGAGESRLFWFVQLSDIHISQFWDPGRQADLRRFCLEWLPVIRPKVVLVTGDLTDAKDVDFVGSEQYPEEWKQYYAAVADSPGAVP